MAKKKTPAKKSSTRPPDSRYELLKDRLILALLTCRTQAEAAKKVGVSHVSVIEWRRRSDFKKLLAEARRDMVREAMFIAHHEAARWWQELEERATDHRCKQAEHERAIAAMSFARHFQAERLGRPSF